MTPSDPAQIIPIPQHVAIIMDGNGRWAKQRGLPRLEGHRSGTNKVHDIIDIFTEYKIRYLTLFAFSTENWNRPQDEVRGLFQILSNVIDRETKALHQKGTLFLGLRRRGIF